MNSVEKPSLTLSVVGPVIPAERVVRWVAIGGIILGSYSALVNAVEMLAWQSALFTFPLGMGVAVAVLQRAARLMLVVGPWLLLIGGIACLRRRAWGRILVLIYSGFAILGMGLTVVLHFTAVMSGRWGPVVMPRDLSFLMNALNMVVFGSVFAVIAVFVLTRAEVKVLFRQPGARGGFEPVMGQKRGTG